jgi:aminoglycoside phosphotransferase family enzyme
MGVIVDPTPPARCAPAPATARRHRVRLAEKVAFLSRPEAYPGRPSPVLTRETHMSWVFLAGDRVFKLKKPVRYPFLDFSTPAAREAACREEVRLNARLAPGIYRGLMVLQWRAGALSMVP